MERQFVSRISGDKCHFFTLLVHKKNKLQLLLLDLANTLHGIAGLVYVYHLDECDYKYACPELYYLLVVYMYGATLCTAYKVFRYFWLFHFLLNK